MLFHNDSYEIYQLWFNFNPFVIPFYFKDTQNVLLMITIFLSRMKSFRSISKIIYVVVSIWKFSSWLICVKSPEYFVQFVNDSVYSHWIYSWNDTWKLSKKIYWCPKWMNSFETVETILFCLRKARCLHSLNLFTKWLLKFFNVLLNWRRLFLWIPFIQFTRLYS